MQNKFIKASIFTILSILLVTFILIQPYNIFCKITTNCHPIILSSIVLVKTGEKSLTINFSANIDEELKSKIEIHPTETSKKILNGKMINNFYKVKNLTDKEINIQARYSASPQEANKYIDRIKCLCFESQNLKAYKERNIPVRLVINKELEKNETLRELKEIQINYEIYLVD